MSEAVEVIVARVYITEGKHVHEKIFKRLHDEEKICGLTVFRGITGFGQSGRVHSSDLLDISLDLPVVIEFFDTPERVESALANLKDLVKPGHVVTFGANLR